MRPLLIAFLLVGCGEGEPPGSSPEPPPCPDASEGCEDTGDHIDTPTVPAVDGTWSLLTGDSTMGWADGIGDAARFNGVTALCAVPGGGAVVLADTFAGTVRHLDLATREVTTLAGHPNEAGVADGLGAAARLAGPRGIGCLDDAVLVADDGALRRITLEGQVSTVAGQSGASGYVDGSAAAARFGYLIHAMTVSPDGSEMLLSDRSNDVVRAVSLADMSVRTLAGGLNGPGGITHDGVDAWVANTFSSRLVRIDAAGDTHTLQTTGASLSIPQGVAFDGTHLWTGGFDGRILRVDPELAEVEQVASGRGGWFASPVVAGDALIAFDLSDSAVRSISLADGSEEVIAGPVNPYGMVNGPLVDARFGYVGPLAVSADGRQLVVADPDHGRLRWVDRDAGEVTTWIGPGGLQGGELPTQVGGLLFDGDRVLISDVGRGRVVSVDRGGDLQILGEGLSGPAGLALGDGVIYVAEASGRRVSSVAGGQVTLVAGTGEAGSRGGEAHNAQFRRPTDVVWLPGDGGPGQVVVVDEASHTVWGIDLAAMRVRRIAGVDREDDWVDGDDARFDVPTALTVDGPDAVLVADWWNHALRRIDIGTGEVRTVIGGPSRMGGLGPGSTVPLSESGLIYPEGVVRIGDEVFVASEHGVYLAALPDGAW